MRAREEWMREEEERIAILQINYQQAEKARYVTLSNNQS